MFTKKLTRTNTVVPSSKLSIAIVDRAHGFPYSKKLDGHKACVNALKFSSGEGRFLASGGDDMWICLWDFHQEEVTNPSHSLRLGGPKGNIFSIEFSVNNKYLFCGGASSVVLRYDIASLGSTIDPFTNFSPNYVYQDHDDSIRGITCHPSRDEIFMTASEDGAIRRYDVRQPRPSLANREFIQLEREITGIQYHPLMDNLFITSDSPGNVLLWDSRMAFTTGRKTGGVVERYHTKVTRLSEPHVCSPEPSSVSFDREGTKFAVTFLNYLPTIYSLNDPDPLAVLSAQFLPNGSPIPPGQRTYSNACTMKHGAFGGPGPDTEDVLYAGGSDDFRGYVWKIPSLQGLKEQREKYSLESWESNGCQRIAFTARKRDSKVVPVEISTPLCHLTGHESIVNTIAFHPRFLHVATAGVEKRIMLHSPTPSSPCTQNLALSPSQVRQLADEDTEEDSAAFVFALTSSLSTDDVEEQITVRLFNHIIREQGDIDVFRARALRSISSDSEDESMDNDSSMNDSSDEEDLLSG